jgi:hypothetical protein
MRGDLIRKGRSEDVSPKRPHFNSYNRRVSDELFDDPISRRPLEATGHTAAIRDHQAAGFWHPSQHLRFGSVDRLIFVVPFSCSRVRTFELNVPIDSDMTNPKPRFFSGNYMYPQIDFHPE